MNLDPLLPAFLALASCLPVACLLVWRRRRNGRQRRIEAAIHELRRPLQALLLSQALAGEDGGGLGPVDLALAALRQLEAATGTGPPPAAGPVAPDSPSWAQLLSDAADRWQQAAWLCGRAIAVAPEPLPAGTPVDDARHLPYEAPPPAGVLRLAGALDNLILNALLHGTGDVCLAVRRTAGQLELLVTDGHPRQTEDPAGAPAGPGQPSAGGPQGARHGHGLRVVTEAATALGGSFRLDRGRDGHGSAAILALPEYRFVA